MNEIHPFFQIHGFKHMHGCALPLFSLHSKHSLGIGEYLDLMPLIDFMKRVNFKVIQLLPLNDSGACASPYTTVSSIALHPIYLSLTSLPYLDSHPLLNTILERLSSSSLKHKPIIYYHDVLKEKERFLRQYYYKTKKKFSKHPGYQQYKQCTPWLKPYALFKFLSSQFKNHPWTHWPSDIRFPKPSMLNTIYSQHEEEMDYYSLQQYLCFTQFKSVKEHAAKQGVLLKGDIPFLVSGNSCDVWLKNHLFNLDYHAGAKPSQLFPSGQDWGLPLYNWKNIFKDRFNWWKERLGYAENFYDLFRIDHILGFYRIWSIPPGKSAEKGEFTPKKESEYLAQGEKILSKISRLSKLYPIGEDLGSIPLSIYKSLRKLGVPGIKLMTQDRTTNTLYNSDLFPYGESILPKTDHDRYVPWNRYFPLSVTSVSTHDLETIEGWWNSHPDQAKIFCEDHNLPYTKEYTQELHWDILRASHNTSSLFHINPLEEYLALIDNFIYKDPKQNRINVPGTPDKFNWKYKFIPSIEIITSNQKLEKHLQNLSAES